MTKREYFEKVKAIFNHATELDEAAAEMLEATEKELIALDRKNSQRAEKAKEKRNTENAPIVAAIVEYLKGHTSGLASEIATACECSTAKASALCNSLVADEVLTVKDVKIPKVGTRKSYSLA